MKAILESIKKDVVSILCPISFKDIVKLMKEKRTDVFLVEKEDGPIGFFSWTNLLEYIDEKGRILPEDCLTSEMISSPFFKKDVYSDVGDLLQEMDSVQADYVAVEKEGELIGIVAAQTLRGIEKFNNQLQEAQAHLMQLEKVVSIGYLASGVAHDVRNPLAIILQGVERVEKCLESAEKDFESVKQYLGMIDNAGKRANKVITNLLEYSKSSKSEKEWANIYDIIRSTAHLVKGKADLGKVQIVEEFSSEELVINCVPVMIHQVFFSLFVNAIDAMPNGGRITMDAQFSAEDKKIKIRVQDTGKGIKEENLSKIFDPFFTTKEVAQGTGLGLSAVYLILEKHRGIVVAESHIGKGSTFTITLPAQLKQDCSF